MNHLDDSIQFYGPIQFKYTINSMRRFNSIQFHRLHDGRALSPVQALRPHRIELNRRTDLIVELIVESNA